MADVGIVEGNAGTQQATFTVTLSRASTAPVTFTAHTGTGSATTAGGDFVALASAQHQIPAGATSKTFAVTINGDTAAEGNETFTFNVTAPTGATLVDGQALGTIVNDDGPTLSVDDVSVVEGNSGTQVATFTVRLSQAATVPVTYSIYTSPDAAVAGSDYVHKVLTGETIPAGALARTFTVTLNGDTAVEANEAMLVKLSAATGASLFDATGIGTIVNDDGATLSIADIAVTEGHAGTKLATFTLALSQAVGANVSATVRTVDGTALAGSDYVAATQVVTIPAGQVGKAFSVTLNSDATIEADETFVVEVTGAAGGASVRDGSAVATITNDDAVPTLSVNNVAYDELDSGETWMAFTITLSQPTDVPVSYYVATGSGGNATAGVDYRAVSGIVQTINPGETSKPYHIRIYGDVVEEENEIFALNMYGATGATVADGQGIFTIRNDDGVLLSIDDAEIVEGDSGSSTMTLTASLSKASTAPVTFWVTTTAGSATPGADYLHVSNIPYTIPAGQTSAAVYMSIPGDLVAESYEQFNVNITGASGASIRKSQAQGFIVDDD